MLTLLATFYVPSISRNLVSLSKLDVVGYPYTNHDLVSECSTYLWHKRLGHISEEMMERLVKNEILSNLDFTDLSVCVDCIKGKQVKHTKK